MNKLSDINENLANELSEKNNIYTKSDPPLLNSINFEMNNTHEKVCNLMKYYFIN
jgi:hypothetical protein